MAQTPASAATARATVLGETVHYRSANRCWAAAVVESGPADSAQLYLFPLPPTYPMPQAPGTFVQRNGGTEEETWHRLADCLNTEAPKRRRTRRSTGAAAG